MNSKMWISAALGGIVLVSGMTAYFVKSAGNDPEKVTVNRAEVAHSVPAAQAHPSVAPAPEPGARPSSSVESSVTAFATKMANARNLRVFAEESKRKPTEGGYYYAELATTFCRQKMPMLSASYRQSVVSDTGPQAVQRQTALNRLTEMCGDFTPTEISDSYSRLPKQGLSLGDPLVKLTSSLINSKSLEERRANFGSVIATGDPYFTAQQWIYGYGAEAPADKGLGFPIYYFEGKAYTGPALEQLGAAWEMVPCFMGASCNSQTDTVLMAACVEGSKCFNTRQEMIRAGTSSQEQYDATVAMAKRIASYVAAKNPAPFAPKNAS